LLGFAALVLVPVAAHAQASISGVVRDTSGAVLPGVTVEAASPALIEKVRTADTDGAGVYRIINLRPGTYTLTFTLSGFRVVKREGIELTGDFAATVNAELGLGTLEETVTVAGQSPLVDVSSARQQEVLNKSVIEAVPTTRTAFGLATLLPALNSNNGSDTGGSNSISLVFLTTHGSRVTDQRVTLDGLSTNSAEGAGQYSAYMPNITSTQEMAIDYAGGTAEMETGGVRINVIPKEGGNTFAGTGFIGGTTDKFQNSNITQALKDRLLPGGQDIRKIWDYNPGFGGPLAKDRLWFYTAWRYNGEDTNSGGFQNANAGDPTRWDYVASTKPSRIYHEQHSANIRFTWQVNAKNKISGFYDDQWRCSCPNTLSTIEAPESATYWHYPFAHAQTVTWSSPMTSRLLFEAGILRHPEQWHSANTPGLILGDGDITPTAEGQVTQLPGLIQVTEQSTGLNYRGRQGITTNDMATVRSRASVSYVTGTHSFKVGLMHQYAFRDWTNWAPAEGLSYTFLRGSPVQLTQWLRPNLIRAKINYEIGAFVQDQWTVNKLTANLGLRFDTLHTSYPTATLGPTRFAPTRNIVLPDQDQLKWNDLSPRMSATYDVFGNGRTAVNGVLNRYVNAVGLQGFFGDGSNPVQLYGDQSTRTWNDVNNDFIPDCDLMNPLANTGIDICGPLTNANFGKPIPTAAVNPEITKGWSNRPYNWELGTSVRHQLTNAVAMNVSYYRRWYGNFIAKDNLATTAADYDKFSITAPVDPRLPNGGGYVIDDLYDLNPAKVGQVNNYYTFASDYGKQTLQWDGWDVGVNTRLSGVILQGGFSMGRTVSDNCEILAKSPEIESSTEPPSASAAIRTTITPSGTGTAAGVPYCHQNSGYLTNVKGFGSYTIPRAEVQVSSTLQVYQAAAAAGSQITNPIFSMAAANFVATNAIISPSLGRNLSQSANATVNLIAPGSVHGDVIKQLDVSAAKIIRAGRTRTTAKVELFNVLNFNGVLTENANYAAFRAPLTIQQARFVKFGLQFDF
jgi:hypothetical protein